jgi:hypothetical protein
VILVLGAGAVAEAVGRAAGVQTTKPPTKPATKTATAQDDPCKKPIVVQKATITGSGKPRTVLFADGCCIPGGHTLLAGFGALKDPNDQTHMKPLIDALKTDPLMEYCVFAFGLNEAQAKALQASYKASIK